MPTWKRMRYLSSRRVEDWTRLPCLLLLLNLCSRKPLVHEQLLIQHGLSIPNIFEIRLVVRLSGESFGAGVKAGGVNMVEFPTQGIF